MAADKSEISEGARDPMVFKTVGAIGPPRPNGIARRIEQISAQALQGTTYASLAPLMQKGWISGAWGTSDHNRKEKFYSITRAGRKQLDAGARNWERISGVIGRVLRIAERG
jgi:PadR family transcriptional regulator PadR